MRSKSTLQQQQGQSSRLLKLPLEIREQILLHLLQPSKRVIHPHSRQPWITDIYRYKTHAAPAILSVCHQLHDESQTLICRRARLVVYPQAETLPQLSRLLIRKYVKHIDIAIPLLEQDSRISTRRKRAMTLLAASPEKVVAKLDAAFPAVTQISLTMCPMLSRMLPVLAYTSGRWNYEVRELLRQESLVKYVDKVRLQLNDTMTSAFLRLVEAYRDEARSPSSNERSKLGEQLNMKLGHLQELRGMRDLEMYFTTQLSKTSHNRPIIWAMHTGEGGADPGPNTTSASEAMVTRHLRGERLQMEGLQDILREMLPCLGGARLKLYRMLYWKGSVMVENVDLGSQLESEVKKLLKHRTIVGSPNVGVDSEADLMSLRSRE